MKRGDDFRNQLRAPVVRDYKKKITDDFACTQPRNDFLNDGVLGFHAHRRACQKRAQFGGLRVRCGKFAELLGSRLDGALGERNVRHRIRVLEARGLQFGLPSRLFTKLLMSDSCACGVSCLASSVSAPSTAKLIHLKISVARSAAALPPSPAACAPAAAKNNTNRTPTAKKARRFRVIEPRSRARRDAAEFAGCGARFRRKAARP